MPEVKISKVRGLSTLHQVPFCLCIAMTPQGPLDSHTEWSDLQILRNDVTCLLHPVEFISNIFGLECSCQGTSARNYVPYLMTFFLAYVSSISLTFVLAFYLVYLRRFFVVKVRRGTLRSRACSWGPARGGGRRKEEGRKEEGRRRAGLHKL